MKDILCFASFGIGSFLLGLAGGAYISRKASCPECPMNAMDDYFEDNDEDYDIVVNPYNGDFEMDTYKEYVKTYSENRSENVDGRNVDSIDSVDDSTDEETLLTPASSIFPIDFEEFGVFEDDWVTDTLVYYEEDGIVCDMMNDKVIDYKDYVGEDALNWFGKLNDDEDLVYIRNYEKKMDFEFVREHTSYKKAVLGLDPEAEEAADIQVQNALDYFGVSDISEVDSSDLADFHQKEREDE